ncbi:hypothetical protein A2555_02175 [Candidatus Falkowbacteria bacterium RIFOXYD2_FULL_39_16]|nr:MAG: hypothetical protein A2555_02175 [Candidatus Falkowbacteria bacterium RIFOXYD2_FULL_39_16]
MISGLVKKGKGVGRTLGYPTANIDCNFDLSDGVFYALVRVENVSLPSLLIKGFIQQGMEVHIIDWSGDLYGKDIEIEVLEKLRDIIKFDKVDELVEQIQGDIMEARKYFKNKI